MTTQGAAVDSRSPRPHFHAMGTRITSALLAAAILLIATGAAVAQYDRDGRYVPSPNGIPRDPYASTVPGYSGTPGGGRGTPTVPRGSIPEAPVIVRPRSPEPQVRIFESMPVPLAIEQCDDAWSKSLRMTRVEFNRRCARLRRR
jgi:hypothetical protein